MRRHAAGRAGWSVLAGVVAIVAVLALPKLPGDDSDAHAGILQRLRERASDQIESTHAMAVTLGGPERIEVGGARIRLVGGYPEPADLPKLLPGLEALEVRATLGSLRIQIPTARVPARCRLEYVLAPRLGVRPTLVVEDRGC